MKKRRKSKGSKGMKKRRKGEKRKKRDSTALASSDHARPCSKRLGSMKTRGHGLAPWQLQLLPLLAPLLRQSMHRHASNMQNIPIRHTG